MSDLARAMLEWERRKRELDLLTEQIENAVLVLGHSIDVGYVHARYSNPRKEYDYEGAGSAQSDDVIGKYTLTESRTFTDWRALCKGEGLDAPVLSEGPAKVKITLTGGV